MIRVTKPFAQAVGCSALYQYNEIVSKLHLENEVESLITEGMRKIAREIRGLIDSKCDFDQEMIMIEMARKDEVKNKHEEKMRIEHEKKEKEREEHVREALEIFTQKKKMADLEIRREKEIIDLDKVLDSDTEYDTMFEKFARCCMHEHELEIANKKIESLVESNSKLALAGKALRSQVEGLKDIINRRKDWMTWGEEEKRMLFNEVMEYIKKQMNHMNTELLLKVFRDILDNALTKKRSRTISF